MEIISEVISPLLKLILVLLSLPILGAKVAYKYLIGHKCEKCKLRFSKLIPYPYPSMRGKKLSFCRKCNDFLCRASDEASLAAMKADKAAKEAAEKEIVRLQKIPTSSNSKILGKKVLRQIRMVRVDNQKTQKEAEFAFLSEVDLAGGNAVINMSSRRHHGGFVSIQGDAVVCE